MPTTEEYIEKARKVHGDRYDYSSTIYTKTHNNLDIICREHGVFSQIAGNHLRGAGCPDCAGLKAYTFETFKDKVTEMYDGKYKYTLVGDKFSTKTSLIRVECTTHIVCFEHKANNHLLSPGCPVCSFQIRSDLQKTKGRQYSQKTLEQNHLLGDTPAKLYYVSLIDLETSERFYKLGITVKDLTRRFRGFKPYIVEKVHYVFEGSLRYIAPLERILLNSMIDNALSYTPEKYFAGHTECFK